MRFEKKFVYRSVLLATMASLLIVWTELTSTGLAAEAEFVLHDGDRVVFLGDSITEQKLYTTYIEAYTVTRFPKQRFNFWNSGWGGDTAWLRMRTFPDEKALFAAEGDAQQKLVEAAVDGPLTRDVVSLKPTVVTVNFGMNDHNYEAFREDIFKAYVRSQTEIVKVLKKNGTRVVLMTPQPIENLSGDPSADARNKAIRKFADGLKDVAAKEGATFVDQFDPYMAIVRREHAIKVDTRIGGGDEVHPGPAGHTLMAAIILKQLKAPSLVSSAEFALSDDQGGKVVNATQCAVSNVKFDKGMLSFDRADDCLPMPIDERAMAALKLGPVLEDVNRYELKVAGLKEDLYDVLIDGEVAATVTKEELAKGLNLAAAAGPITRQTQEVLSLIFKKNLVGQTLWEAKLRAWRKKERPGLQKQIDDFEAQITGACQPKPHRFEVKPNHNALDAAINAGDFSGYFTNISTWLSEKLPADSASISEAAMQSLLKDPAFANTLSQRQLLLKVGAVNVEAFAKADKENKAFLTWLLRNTQAMDLYLEAATPTGLKAREANNWAISPASLELWKKLYYADPDSRQGIYLKLAIATALNPPGTVNIGAGGSRTPADPLVRYKYYKAAHQNKELVPGFDKLTVWDYTKIVSSGASDEDLSWGREMVNSFRPDLRVTEMVVDMTGLVWRRNSTVPYTNMKTVLQGGGKCGPRSSFAVFINHAFGIPAIGVGQPAHACVAWRGVDGVWRVGYGRGWAASRLDGLTGPDFVEGSLARSRGTQFSQVEHLRWLAASATASHGQASAVLAVAQKIAQAAPASAVDLNASLKPDEANADPGVEAAKAGQPKVKATAKPVEPVKAGPVKAVQGVLHVEAAGFTATDGQAFYTAQKGVMRMDSPAGGKQVYFQQQQNHCWADYAIDAPAKGTYEIVMSVAAINDGQLLEVGSDAYNAVALVHVPMSHGLWATTKPVDVKLEKGIQKVRVAVLPNERGIALRWFELKQK
ncbi:MAG: GDSL-type esterase/lipase family protein [Planctomycetota bacterium]